MTTPNLHFFSYFDTVLQQCQQNTQYICRYDAPLQQSRSESQQHNSGVMEPDSKGAATAVSASDFNTYSEV